MMHITLPSLLYSAPGAVPEALRTPERRQQLVLMRDAGIHTMEIAWGLQHGWSEDGRFDFATLDEGLAEMAAMAPEIRLLLRVDTRAPDWWGARWPEELVGYALSPTHASTETSDMAADAGPRRVSLAAPRWRRAAAAGLRALVRHVRGSASGRRVLGLMSACGTFGEWHYWGFLHLPDTGPAMTAHFRRWAARRYRTPEAAGAAWGMPIAGWGDVRVPGLERIANEASAFRAGSYAAWTLDYVRCHQALAADTLLHFCRTVKQASAGELLAGAFYGYLFHTPWRDEGGHLEYARVVRSRWVDYLSGPQIYELRARDLGGSGLDRGLIADVLRHGKLWFSEADTPTHIGRRMAYFWRTPEEIARNAADSIALIRRDAARAFTQGNQLWWFDFGRNYTGGEYLDDEIMAEIAQLARLDGEMARLDRTPVAQVAVVYHPASLYHMAHWRAGRDGVSGGVTDGLVHQAQYLGAPAEVLQAEGVTARHRLVIVANAFYLSPGERTRLHRRLCRDDRTVVWLYASGALGSDARGRPRASARPPACGRRNCRRRWSRSSGSAIAHGCRRRCAGRCTGISPPRCGWKRTIPCPRRSDCSRPSPSRTMAPNRWPGGRMGAWRWRQNARAGAYRSSARCRRCRGRSSGTCWCRRAGTCIVSTRTSGWPTAACWPCTPATAARAAWPCPSARMWWRRIPARSSRGMHSASRWCCRSGRQRCGCCDGGNAIYGDISGGQSFARARSFIVGLYAGDSPRRDALLWDRLSAGKGHGGLKHIRGLSLTGTAPAGSG